MLGVRLSQEIEHRFTRFARAKGRPKSDIARTAIVEYLDRHGDDHEFERQLKAAAEMERNQPTTQQEIKELDEAAWRMTNDLA
jgi:predicted transcriptional regulator